MLSGFRYRISTFPEFWTLESIRRTEQFCSGRAREFAVGDELGCLLVEGSGAFLAEPMVTVSGVVAESFFVLLEKPGVVHGTKLANEDGFGFLIEFGGECHGSEMMSMGLRKDIISWL